MGLFLAVSFSSQRALRKGEPISKRIMQLSWAPTICCFIVAAMEFSDKDTNSAVTWAFLGAAMILLSCLRTKQNEKIMEDETKAQEASGIDEDAESEDI